VFERHVEAQVAVGLPAEHDRLLLKAESVVLKDLFSARRERQPNSWPDGPRVLRGRRPLTATFRLFGLTRSYA
jgi:hypothetical protein